MDKDKITLIKSRTGEKTKCTLDDCLKFSFLIVEGSRPKE